MLAPLPKELASLPDAVAQLAAGGDDAAQAAADLEGLLPALRALAKPPPVFPEQELDQRLALALNRARVALAFGGAARAPLHWAAAEMEWRRRRARVAERRVGVGGLAVASGDEFADLKLPRHLYLELKRAREQAMPEMFRERCYRYLNTVLEKAR